MWERASENKDVKPHCSTSPWMRGTERIIHEKKNKKKKEEIFRHWLEINYRDQIKIWFSHTLFVFGINRLLICYSWILLMTGAVNSSTKQKPIITLSALSLCGKRKCGSQRKKQKHLDLPGKKNLQGFFFFYWVFLFCRACQHIDFTDTGAVAQRLVWFINGKKLLKLSIQT